MCVCIFVFILRFFIAVLFYLCQLGLHLMSIWLLNFIPFYYPISWLKLWLTLRKERQWLNWHVFCMLQIHYCFLTIFTHIYIYTWVLKNSWPDQNAFPKFSGNLLFCSILGNWIGWELFSIPLCTSKGLYDWTLEPTFMLFTSCKILLRVSITFTWDQCVGLGQLLSSN